MRKVALDLGDVRIGIATSDSTGTIASGYETYTRKGDGRDFAFLAQFFSEHEADTVVIGLPKNMDGSEGPRVEVTRAFAAELAQYTSLPIVFMDERLTTVQAERMLISGGVRRDKRKKVIDKVAATIILQSYLDRANH